MNCQLTSMKESRSSEEILKQVIKKLETINSMMPSTKLNSFYFDKKIVSTKIYIFHNVKIFRLLLRSNFYNTY